uniref:ATP synthase subunit 8 n=1 Tax=Helobdella robusta TaxID=6412 RepID=Q9MNJ1_HELRO|nr:ATP synthase subunit 8 [Helobdella robusta]
MPHLAPMPWMNFMVILWLLLMIIMSNLWWFMNKPMKQINKNTLKSSLTSWKW